MCVACFLSMRFEMVTALTATEISMLQDKMLIEYTPAIDGEPRARS